MGIVNDVDFQTCVRRIDCMDHIALLEAAVDRFEQQPVPKGGPALASFLERVQRVNDRIALRASEAAAAFAGTDHYEDDGFVSPQHWMRVNLHMTCGASGDRIAVGEQLPNLPESHQSLLAGEIGYAHLAHIARTAVAIEESGTNRQFDETPLLEKARELPVGRFIDFCRHMRHAGDPVGYADEEAQKVELRSLTLRKGEGGMVWVRGVLDPEGAAVLRTAIESLARRNGKGDERTHDRRFADAVVELASHSLDNALVPQHGSVRPHLNVNTTLETLLKQAGAPAADLEFSLPISAEADCPTWGTSCCCAIDITGWRMKESGRWSKPTRDRSWRSRRSWISTSDLREARTSKLCREPYWACASRLPVRSYSSRAKAQPSGSRNPNTLTVCRKPERSRRPSMMPAWKPQVTGARRQTSANRQLVQATMPSRRISYSAPISINGSRAASGLLAPDRESSKPNVRPARLTA